MAKKTTKTRASQYEAILKDKGYNIADCKIISFVFPTEMFSHAFHFRLMDAKIEPLIYDGPETIVRLAVTKNDDNLIKYQSIAEEYEGVYKECKAYNDYE